MASELTTPSTAASGCTQLGTLEHRLASLADAGLPAIEERMAELEREWTAGRMTKVAIGIAIVVGLALTALVGAGWLILPAVAGVFLLQYLFSRTSWLGRAFHQMGFRTGMEVDQEKMALKLLRGDFRSAPTVLDIENREEISRLEGEGGISLQEEAAKVDSIDAARSALEATKG